MAVPDAVHVLPLTLDLDDRRVTLHPAAIETDRGVLLVDTGWPGAIDQLDARLADAGFDWNDVWGVLLTHQDGDHAGGLADVVDRADPVVFAHRECAPYVDGREHPVKLDDERYPPARVHVELSDGVRFHTAAGPFEAVFTPGHAPGHVSLYAPDERFLLAADALHAPEGDLDGPRGSLDEKRAVDSIGTLADRDVGCTLTYHHGAVDHDPGAIEAVWKDATPE